MLRTYNKKNYKLRIKFIRGSSLNKRIKMGQAFGNFRKLSAGERLFSRVHIKDVKRMYTERKGYCSRDTKVTSKKATYFQPQTEY